MASVDRRPFLATSMPPLARCALLLLLLNLGGAAGQVLSTLNITALGCYGDTFAGRALAVQLRASPDMTVDACAQLANAANYAVFGLQYASECYAGKNETLATRYGPSTACNMACHGADPTGVCGGPLANSVYRLPEKPPSPPPAPVPGQFWTYRGCFADTLARMVATGAPGAPATMTIAQCAQFARDMSRTVFALQYGGECFASNDLVRAESLGQLPEESCYMPCGGSAADVCGGPNANSLFTIPAPDGTPPPPPTPPPAGTPPAPAPAPVAQSSLNITALGCYGDNFAGRALAVQLRASPDMTVDACAQLANAANYAVFGLQYASECYAGKNETLATRYGPSTACNMACHGADPTGVCGGPLANSVYRLPEKPPSPPPAPVPGQFWTYRGCFADTLARMVATGAPGAPATMTTAQCAQFARDTSRTVFALQYGGECFASNDLVRAESLGQLPEESCYMPCGGSAADVCGGPNANSLFTIPAPDGTPPPPPTPPPAGTPPAPAPAPVAQSSLNITALGCYGDQFGTRAVPILLRVNPDMTVDACAQLANAANYAVFGLQYASECYAGKNETLATRYGPSTACNMACHGADPTGVCGGPLANSVYRLPEKPPSPPPAPVPGQFWTYRGCFADTVERMVLSVPQGEPATMTTAQCAQAARSAYKTVFATQYGGQCFISEDLDRAESLGQLPEESCYMPCGGSAADVCGGPNANSLYTVPPPGPPADVPPFQSLGCFADDQVFDTSFDPPSPIKRRMWRRLGQVPGMDSWECARRAAAAGYPLFGLTSGEMFPAYGFQCWGAFDLAHVTALGNSSDCTNVCKEYRGADKCGGSYAISLYRLTNVTHDQGAGGYYQLMMEFPVSSSHTMQVTGRDDFLMIDFLGGNRPSTWDGANSTYMWTRGNNTARSVLNIRDASCGMWVRLSEGDFAGFSGYFGASGVNEYSVWATMLYHRYQHRAEDFGDRAMPFGRWYGGAMLLPDGRVYVTGGDENGPGYPRALGSDVWDPAHKSYVGRHTSMGLNTPYLQLNAPLFFASEVGGYYPGMWPLPSGGMLFSQAQTVQVINPATGAALAAAPPLPRPNYWEYPLSGSQVLLREPVVTPGSDVTLWFMVFGGGHQAYFYKPCSDFSLRIRLDVRCSVSPCTHTFGEWEVETMPGHRCMLDTAVLPNGKIVILGGTEEGLSNLDYRPNSNNVPSNEPWIYDPEAPAGRRYRRTGAFSRIARFYHGTHLMTSDGDILCGGSTVAQGFTSYHMADFDITPYEHAECRIELFRPHFILGPRPAWAAVPTQVAFGAAFTVTLAANTSMADIVAVVLADPGTTTHSSNMGTRSMQLAWTPAGGQSLTVTAPANIHIAQPGFYQLFAVSRDDSYSVGRWMRLRGPWGSTPASLPAPSQLIAAASSTFELDFVPWSINPYGTAAASVARTAAAAGSGDFGLTVTAGGNQPIVLAGPALALTAGTRVNTFVWARAATDDVVQLQYLLLDAANLPAASSPVDAHADVRVNVLATWQLFTLGGLVVNATGSFYPAVTITGLTAGQSIALDDIEVFTLTAADAQASLALVRAGTPVGSQLAPPTATAPAAKRLRRLHGQQAASNSSANAWNAPPALLNVDVALKQELQSELDAKLITGQHASSALAGVKVGRMTHTGAGPGHAGGAGGHQHP